MSNLICLDTRNTTQTPINNGNNNNNKKKKKKKNNNNNNQNNNNELPTTEYLYVSVKVLEEAAQHFGLAHCWTERQLCFDLVCNVFILIDYLLLC